MGTTILLLSSSAAADPGPTRIAERATSVAIPPRPTPPPSPIVEKDDDDWYGHWTLLAGTSSALLYSSAVFGIANSDAGDDDEIGAGIASGWLMIGHLLTGALIHSAHDNDDATVASPIMRLAVGVLTPMFTSLACGEGEQCAVAIGVATAATSVGTVAVESALLAWD